MVLWTETETQINDLLSQGMIPDGNPFRIGYPQEIQIDDEVDEGKDLPVTPSDWVGKRLCGEGYEGNKRRGQESKSISFHLLFYSIISCWTKRIGKRGNSSWISFFFFFFIQRSTTAVWEYPMGLGVIRKGIPQQVYQDSVSEIVFYITSFYSFLFSCSFYLSSDFVSAFFSWYSFRFSSTGCLLVLASNNPT